QVRVTIDPGAPVVVRDVQLDVSGEAEDDPRFAALLDAFPLREGSPLRHGDYLRFKSLVDVLARERGYLDGRFVTERIDVYLDSGTADIALACDSGQRYRFGDVTFRADAVSDRVLESFVAFEEGEPYDAALIAELQRDLLTSEFFSQVDVAAA